MSSFLVLSERDTRNRWRDGQVCPEVGQGTMAPWARRPGCVLACYAQIGRGRPRDFCDLPIRRDEGRVVNTPLVLKGFFFRRRGRKKETREREREREEPGLGWRKGKSPALDGEGMRGEPWLERTGSDCYRKGLSPRLECCEKYMIQASPVPACGIIEYLFACARSAVFQISKRQVPEFLSVPVLSSTNLKVSLFIEIIFGAATEY
ncbi:hypothetical protein TNCV_1804041 [Trichonephila clavipes]|nr:hypothetical protein TNCV_1804041 [Trichonephila clavipes]